MTRTLVAYASKSGATEETAKTIADVLKKYNFEIDLANLRKDTPNVGQYENVVVGAGVRAGKVYSEALKFLKQDFGNREVAVFICCGEGGDPEKHDGACAKYLFNALSNYPNFKPVATEAFGGRMKMFGKRLFDTVDSAKTSAWAEKLTKEFVK